MPQFIVRVYRSAHGYRVVVDGVTHFDTDRREAIEGLAREAILSRIRAYLPPRALPRSDPEVVSTLLFDVALSRAAGPEKECGEPTGPTDPTTLPSGPAVSEPRPPAPAPSARGSGRRATPGFRGGEGGPANSLSAARGKWAFGGI
ncbi:MAG: hypothetical protein ACLQD8_02340 [Thermoplasmata archaeon]